MSSGGHRGADGRLLVMLSALQHYSYCPRQCGLIHLEQTFDENLYTLRGRQEHARVDEAPSEWRGAVRVERSLPLWSERLGVIGRGDVVELSYAGGEVVGARPVEYKHGKRHAAIHDEIQLCAQALCLEEMFGLEVGEGDIYHVSSRKRRGVAFDEGLRRATLAAIEAVRALLEGERLPAPVADARCKRCSLVEACMPHALERMRQGGAS